MCSGLEDLRWGEKRSWELEGRQHRNLEEVREVWILEPAFRYVHFETRGHKLNSPKNKGLVKKKEGVGRVGLGVVPLLKRTTKGGEQTTMGENGVLKTPSKKIVGLSDFLK